MPCARSQRASQKPSRPASNATAIRLILRPGLLRFLAPAMQQLEQSCFVWVQLLCQMPLRSRNNAGDEPARLAHLDHCDQRAILVESGERPAQIIRLWHGGTPSVVLQRR